MEIFSKGDLKKLYRPDDSSSGEENGQVTIIGGSKLFHGAPILSLKAASKFVDMVFFATPAPSVGDVVAKIKSDLSSFIWVPWDDVEAYITKSDAILIGPGLMRFGSEKTPERDRNANNHHEGRETYEITKQLLSKFPDKKWVVDAGSLQVIKPGDLPKGCIITPNKKEYELLFGEQLSEDNIHEFANKFQIVIVAKGPQTLVVSPNQSIVVDGGNAGLTKGGTGDVLAGLTVALLAKNEPFLAAAAASYIEKFTADDLHNKVGTNYSADDLVGAIPAVLHTLSN